MKIIASILLTIILISCNRLDEDYRVKPDFVKDGHEYVIREKCVKSHKERKYGYHYGWSSWKLKYCWHFGYETKTICDSTSIDTLEVNLPKIKN